MLYGWQKGSDPFLCPPHGLVLAPSILQMIFGGFNLAGAWPHPTPAIWGGILILAMAIGFLKARGRRRRARVVRRRGPPPRPPKHPAEQWATSQFSTSARQT